MATKNVQESSTFVTQQVGLSWFNRYAREESSIRWIIDSNPTRVIRGLLRKATNLAICSIRDCRHIDASTSIGTKTPRMAIAGVGDNKDDRPKLQCCYASLYYDRS